MTLAGWTPRRWLAAVAGMVAAALIVGVPADIVPTSLFERMTPVLWWNYPIWVVSSILSGLVLATYVRTDTAPAAPSTMGVGANLLSLLAVGCPVCNKLIVVALGTAGALTIWAPVQPVIGLASLILLGWALFKRLTAEQKCRAMPSRSASGMEQTEDCIR